MKAHIVYKYARGVLSTGARTVEKKEEIKNWLKTMPPQPTNNAKGFLKGFN